MGQELKVFTAYHLYLSILLEYLLKDKGFDVKPLVKVGTLPLEIDIIIIKKKLRKQKHRKFTHLDFFFNRLTSYNIIEFKGPTDTLRWQDYLHLRVVSDLYRILINHPANNDVGLFLIASNVSKTYKKFMKSQGLLLIPMLKGMYEVHGAIGYRHYVIELNQLKPDRKNELLLFFSSKYRKNISKIISNKESLITFFLTQELFQKERQKMKFKIKDEDLVNTELKEIISRFPAEFKLAGVKPEEVFKKFSPEELLQILSIEERLRGLPTEEILKRLPPEEILRILISEENIKGINTEKLPSEINNENLDELIEILIKLKKN